MDKLDFNISSITDADSLHSKVVVNNTFLNFKQPTTPPLQKSFSMPIQSSIWDNLKNEFQKLNIQLVLNGSENEDESNKNNNIVEKEKLLKEESHSIKNNIEPMDTDSRNLSSFYKFSNDSTRGGSIFSTSEENDIILTNGNIDSNFTIRSPRLGKNVVEYYPSPISMKPSIKILTPKSDLQNQNNFDNSEQSKISDEISDTSSDKNSTNKNNAISPDELTDDLLQKIPRNENGELLSVGSINHNEGNCKGCVFFHHPNKTCNNGVLCLFCHYPHPVKKRVRMNKNRNKKNKNLGPLYTHTNPKGEFLQTTPPPSLITFPRTHTSIENKHSISAHNKQTENEYPHTQTKYNYKNFTINTHTHISNLPPLISQPTMYYTQRKSPQ